MEIMETSTYKLSLYAIMAAVALSTYVYVGLNVPRYLS